MGNFSPVQKEQTSVTGRVLAFSLIASTLLAGTARAQSRDRNLERCTGDDIQLRIIGCSALINSGQETPETLAIAYLNRGNALADNGQFDVALLDYDQAIKNNPLSAEAFYRRGIANEQQGQFDRAIADYDNTLKLDPKNAKAFANRGYAHSHKKEFDGAIEDYTQAIKLDPDDAVAYYVRGLSKQKKGDKSGSKADIAKAKQLDPKVDQP